MLVAQQRRCRGFLLSVQCSVYVGGQVVINTDELVVFVVYCKNPLEQGGRGRVRRRTAVAMFTRGQGGGGGGWG